MSLLLFTFLLLIEGSTGSYKVGKLNVSTSSGNLFACKQVLYSEPFGSGQEVRVLTSFGHSVKNLKGGEGAAIWLESENQNGFKACVLEFSDGSNGTAEINWLAIQAAPVGAQLGTNSLDPWTTGTECKTISFQQRFSTPPTILVTPSHQDAVRPQDALVFWVEDSSQDSFKICLREVKLFDGLHKNIKINWLAYNNLTLENFTLIDTVEFANKRAPSKQNNIPFCQHINFTDPFYATPVVIVMSRLAYNKSILSAGSECSAAIAWVEYASTTGMEICMRNYDYSNKHSSSVDYMVIGDLDPCLGVTCDFGLCKAFGPYDARCVCLDKCPSYQKPLCSSNGTTYDNECLFEQEMCLLRQNFTVQHPGSCEGFPFQRGRRHMPHIPSLGYSHCEIIHLQHFVFYPDKPIEVQITVNHIDTSDMSYVHDATVSWVEEVNLDRFTACVMAAGFNERKSHANVTVDWLAYQGAPVGGVSGEVRISQWWTGTTCEVVKFPAGKFSQQPFVFVTAAHHHAGLKRDAASVWLEDITHSSFKICLRELENYAGSHEDIFVKWLALLSFHSPFFSEHSSVYFANTQHPPADHNNAFCKDLQFKKMYRKPPSIFVSANHTSKGGNIDPMHNSITAWVEYINMTGARACFKELFVSKYDPLSISYTIMSDICPLEWNYFDSFCYLTSRQCTSWLNAESNCTAMGANLVTVHNQEENVFIQHRIDGGRSWIGLNDRSVEGSFVWTNKEVSSFRFWAAGQPNNWKKENCVHTLGAKHGYTWNDVPCDNCNNFTCFKDMDECTANYHICDKNAVCQNTEGSYTCSCKAGYTGDGKNCRDIDECASGVHDCHRFASCENTDGSYKCACNHPSTGNGKTCSHPVAPECQNYQSLNESDRNVRYSRTYGLKCDEKIGPGWFRFEGAAGTRIATSCTPAWRCNTDATGWMTSGHPTVAEGVVSRTVCFRWDYCCYWSTTIQVRNCGSYYIYFLDGTDGVKNCSMRYCGTD